MKETPLTRDISVNIGRAAQYDLEGDPTAELGRLLFAAQDIIKTLKAYRSDRMFRPPTEWLDLHIATRHTDALSRISHRIAELIEQGA